MVPQWLKLAFGVKRALGVLLAFEENGGSSTLIWNVLPYVILKDLSSSPFSALPAQRIWPANETRPCERHMCVCVIAHTVTQVFAVGSLTFLVFPQRECSGGPGGDLSHG
jgi:hypothetical protein